MVPLMENRGLSENGVGPHFLVGDGHYLNRPGEAERWRRLLERAVDRGAREVSVLGDLFELWIGLIEQPWQDEIFAPLRELRRQGVRLRYVVGNKDYFVAEWNARAKLFDEVLDPGGRLDSPQGPLHLAHGDLVNARDRQYRAWRRVSRSAPFALTMRAVPRRWLSGVAERVAGGMQRTNRYHKSYFPEAELRARASELGPGAALMVYGHFHVHRELEEGDKRIVTLPFLGGEGAGLLLTAAGLERIDA
jgi:UDP-2,3-diacylglucosamine pyrophosphatase LpxH